MADSTAKTLANILYALAAGLAAATITALGPLLVAFVAAWTFHRIEWTRAAALADRAPSYFAVFVVLGVAVGLTTCLRVLGSKFRREAEFPGKR